MATTQSTTVVAVFDNPSDAQAAINDLRAAGFREDQVGIVTRDDAEPAGATASMTGYGEGGAAPSSGDGSIAESETMTGYGTEPGTMAGEGAGPGSDDVRTGDLGGVGWVTRDDAVDRRPATRRMDEPHAGEAIGGVVAGGALGGLLGAAAALLIPGIGPVVAGGVLAAGLGGAAIGAATGGLIGALTDMGVPEDDARYYEGELRSGRTILAVQADGRLDEARAILQRQGAIDASPRAGSPRD